jgi:hypothetical protein
MTPGHSLNNLQPIVCVTDIKSHQEVSSAVYWRLEERLSELDRGTMAIRVSGCNFHG